MSSSVVLKGVPHDVPIKILAYHLDKFLDTDEIGTFKVKELALNSTSKWQIVINFKSSYDAFTAQSILQGFKYKWKDGEEYVLQAKVTDDPSGQSNSWQKLANETWGHSYSTSLVPHMSQEDARSCNDMLDMKLELLRKQKLLLQTEREVVEEKRKLEKEYRRKHNSDSEDDEVTKHRSRKKKAGKLTDGSKRVRTSSDEGSRSKHRSQSRSSSASRSRSRAVSRSVIREITPDHSRSRAVSRSIVREIPSSSHDTYSLNSKMLAVYKPPVHARLGPIPESSKAYWPTDPEHFDYSRPRSRYSGSPVRPRSPDSPPYDRPRSRDHYRRRISPDTAYGRRRSPDSAYSRPRSREYSESYRHPRSPEYVSPRGRPRSPEYVSPRGRPRSQEYVPPRGRPRSQEYVSPRGRPRSQEYVSPRGRRGTPDVNDRDRYGEHKSRGWPRSRHSRSPEHAGSSRRSKDYDAFDESPDRSGKRRERGRRYDDKEPSSSREENTNTKVIDITIQIKRKKSKEPAKSVTTETVTNETNESPKKTTDAVVIKTEYDNDNKDNDFKLQMSKAIREIMTSLQGLIDAKGVQERERKSLVKTVQSILVKRLRFLPLDKCMVSDDIVHVYKYTHTDKDDSALIVKLIEQLSDPKIVIEDSDMPEPPDADSKIWSIIDQVLEDLKMDYFSDDDDAQTVIVENEDGVIDNNTILNEDNIKSEKIDADIAPNIPELITEIESNANQDSIPEPKKKKHGPRNKIHITEDISQKKIPLHPKFVITVKNLLKKMRPYIYELHGDINVLRILDVTTYEIRKKIKKLVEGKPYMRSADITKLYRERYPKDKDLKFVWKIIENFKNGVYSDLTKMSSDHIDDKSDEVIETMIVTEENDDVIIVEHKDVIMVVDDEGDDVSSDVKPEIPQVSLS